jgi:hypothetical protein
MNINFVTSEELENVKKELLEEIKNLLSGKRETEEVMKSGDVTKMLGISTGTLQNYRLNGTLPFKKVGGTIFYKRSDVLKLVSDECV